jgi:GT2 family glycosyltransferase
MKDNNNIDVSIVIVCMNNLKNLYPCLEGIRKYTNISYETLVVAYFFSIENLQRLKIDYPWITIIESNEIRGFSENNNMALKKAKGEYCFILNDDTLIKEPVIDELATDIEKLPKDVAVISPKTVFKDGKIQSCGRPKMNWGTYILSYMGIWKEQKIKSKYTNKNGLFQSYTLVGAAFLIKTAIFRQIGGFDEMYFFCPEDIALGCLLNNMGYKCYVDANVTIYHIEGSTGSKYICATKPAGIKGSIIFYAGKSKFKYLFLSLITFIITLAKLLYHKLKSNEKHDKNYYLYKSDINIIKCIFKDKTPKDVFIDFYNSIQNYE